MEDTLRNTLIPVLFILFVSSSCGFLQRSKNEKDGKTVSRKQYDQLLVKYEELSKKYEALKDTGNSSTLADEIQSARDTETVDLFNNPVQPAQAKLDVPADIESQLSLYRRALGLKASNPGESTKIFQQLESQGIPPVQARAKLQIGLMLFEKQQHDLALQVFEDIIQRNASSGVVLEALNYAVTSSDKLGLKSKRDQYASMLNDVFKTN
jgi:tetratricopeptide (TPR) repeat protein